MSTTQHPADPHHDPRPWQDCTREDIREGDLVERRFLDVVYIGTAHHQDEDGDWWTEKDWRITYGDQWTLRRIPARATEKETPMTETTTPAEPLARTLLAVTEGYGAPHHDAKEIKPDDFVAQVDRDGTIRAGKAHYQAEDGEWQTKDGRWITWAVVRADRPDAVTVWPTPTPPAEEVQLTSEVLAHIPDVENLDGDVCAYMTLDNAGNWCGVDRCGDARNWRPRYINAFTLPDGTRARRDGEHANGEPRFVKVQEGEK